MPGICIFHMTPRLAKCRQHDSVNFLHLHRSRLPEERPRQQLKFASFFEGVLFEMTVGAAWFVVYCQAA